MKRFLKLISDRVVGAWCLYDWANSPFATTLMSALFPPFFRSLVINAGLPVRDAPAYWGYTASAALLIAQLTISFQAVKAASTDPSETLKFE